MSKKKLFPVIVSSILLAFILPFLSSKSNEPIKKINVNLCSEKPQEGLIKGVVTNVDESIGGSRRITLNGSGNCPAYIDTHISVTEGILTKVGNPVKFYGVLSNGRVSRIRNVEYSWDATDNSGRISPLLEVNVTLSYKPLWEHPNDKFVRVNLYTKVKDKANKSNINNEPQYISIYFNRDMYSKISIGKNYTFLIERYSNEVVQVIE
ncbi:hypothetical protein H6G33_09890 [Calothrix sp. FACHB-1219]|uniref:hypothetical protein n=1 Tax=unclassified Calothrix TaxID=2619626 RepID=UPI001689D3D7|nr:MULTISPECIES: hypothetical protein [unclassified Calothrix]MBD2201657.1 hypothetical protein [Calothrix sp. FACHB-168]MBD2217343.1 hypothetical protein [Calothrix sp. FACHB-1219]